MEPIWIVVLPDGENKHIQAAMLGVSPDGSLLCFSNGIGQNQPVAIQGYAPGHWVSFHKSSINVQ